MISKADRYHLMMSDPQAWENFRYIDPIIYYTKTIEECEKIYALTPESDTKERVKLLNAIIETQADLVRKQLEYEDYKEYKERTAISK